MVKEKRFLFWQSEFFPLTLLPTLTLTSSDLLEKGSPMKTLVSILAAMLACLATQAALSSASRPDGGVSMNGLPPPDPSRTANTISGWQCVKKTGCPEGLLLLNGEGNHLGCVAESDSICSGNCYTCAGVAATTYVCVSHSGYNCLVPPFYRIVTCGTRRIHTNACTSSQPSGVPSTPNGCYCDTNQGFQYDSVSCELAECQP